MREMQVAELESDLSQFTYILDKIRSADFFDQPYKHIEIFNFLTDEHFNAVIAADQVALPEMPTAEVLIDQLKSKGYHPIPFPGCTESVRDYLDWLDNKASHSNHEACEGFGVTFRLKDPRAKILVDLNNFFQSSTFKQLLEEKFGLTRPTTIETGLQKYLQGYEISPHPDMRRKALTYMLNVNPASHSEDLDIHTHYLKFKPQKQFIAEYWRYNEDFDTCWVPWDWCETLKQQRQNNSIVIFAPTWNTLHAVKLNYNHLKTQRTQFYGNLWYKDFSRLPKPQYQNFIFKPSPVPKLNREPKNNSKQSKFKSYVERFIPRS